MSSPGLTSSAPNRRQKRMGPAPFASFEDLSDEVRSRLESPEDKQATGSVVRLPGIREDATPNTPALQDTEKEFTYAGISLVGAAVSASPPMSTTPQSSKLQAPSTPRIDISRASSSSHHEDSRDSTPERELFEGHEPASAKLGLGFREEGTLDLRSSTEELDFQDPQSKNKMRSRPASPSLHEDPALGHARKDSQSSDIVLLSISGRTSRLSSIGSQGSAHSRISNASHLSVLSGQSGTSRSPSPHKMLLETSFCGAKPPKTAQASTEQPGTKVDTEVLEKVLLSRKHDPTEAILAEGISLEEAKKQTAEKASKRPVKSDITITVDKPAGDSNNDVPKLPRTYVSASGVEYTYIPLRGPLPPPSTTASTSTVRTRTRDVKSATLHSKSAATKAKSSAAAKPKAKSATPSPVIHKKEEEPKYIRIRLKPEHCYDNDEPSSSTDIQKPYSLNLSDGSKKPPQTFAEIIRKDSTSSSDQAIIPSKSIEPPCQGKSLTSTPSASPKPSRHSFLKDAGSTSPSPSLSRKSSFCSLFRSKETVVSPESPTVPSSKRKNTLTGIFRDTSERSRSRSKSRDRDKSAMSVARSSNESIDSKSKHKSVFSIFKPKKGEKGKTEAEYPSPEKLPEGLANVEFRFNSESTISKGHKSRADRRHEKPLEGDSIRIPLHSPTENRSTLQDLKTSSQDSQDTVIEVTSRNVDAVVEPTPPESNNTTTVQTTKIDHNNRQSSTSSENVVFSTKLGNDNEVVFTTKLPKNKLLARSSKVEEHSEPQEPVPCPIHSEPVPNSTVEVKKTTSSNSLSKEIRNNSSEYHTKNNFAEHKLELDLFSKTVKVTQDAKQNRISTVSSIADEEHNSSESERDSEFEFLKHKKDLTLKLDEAVLDTVEPERKGLVLQQDSFEDELPYVPTTLPLERSVAVPIVPIKQRSTFEMKTCPIERPRSTTPINPSCLEEYCEEVVGSVNVENITKTIEKLKISLPIRTDDDTDKHKLKSPRKGSSNTNWTAFAEKGISQRRPSLNQEETTPPPLPPKGIQKEWINFEEIPERRKPPKRIQTIPSRGTIEVPESVLQENVVYSYVNPEDCKCECHEINARKVDRKNEEEMAAKEATIQEDEVPLLEDDDDRSAAETFDRIKLDIAIDRRSIISDSSADVSANVEHPDANGVDQSLRMPFTSDLGISSNRSSIVSQEESQSSNSGSPNAFSKPS